LAFLQHFAAEDVRRHQVGGELDAAGIEAEHGPERFDELGRLTDGNFIAEQLPSGQTGGTLQASLHHFSRYLAVGG